MIEVILLIFVGCCVCIVGGGVLAVFGAFLLKIFGGFLNTIGQIITWLIG